MLRVTTITQVSTHISYLIPMHPRRLGEELGRGAYGQVFRGLDTRTGQHVAIKQLSLERIPADSLQVRCVPGS